jgi:hypothetical protein
MRGQRFYVRQAENKRFWCVADSHRPVKRSRSKPFPAHVGGKDEYETDVAVFISEDKGECLYKALALNEAA